MKKEIEIPKGYEIDLLTFKKVKKELPTSWEEVINKSWKYRSELSALARLLMLRDIYNDGWIADWTDSSVKYGITCFQDELNKDFSSSFQRVMNFKTPELQDLFLETFKDLLTIAKPLL